MNKETLTNVIDKYYLNGTVETVKWSIKDKNMTIDFITPFKNLVGKITSPNIDIEDCDLGIYNTTQFSKLIKIMDKTIILKVGKSGYGTPLELAISDNQYDLNYYLSDLNLIDTVPNINEPEYYDATIPITSEFISLFINAKKALGDIRQFTIKAELVDNNVVLNVVLGDGSGYANKIKFRTPCEAMLGLNELPFPADIMTEILKANEGMDTGKIEVSEGGLMKLSFREDSIDSIYYLVRLSKD